MAITTYAELQSSIGDWMLRTDLTSVIPDFITLAEARLRRDPRARLEKVVDPFTVDAETETLPTDFAEMGSLYFDGDNERYGEIEIVDFGSLAAVHNQYRSASTPRKAAIVNQTTIRFAPIPDQSYDLILSYLASFDALSDANTSNWILDDHPDIYLYGSLLEAAPYMKDDERIPVWSGLYEQALEELWQDRQRGSYSGRLVRRTPNHIP